MTEKKENEEPKRRTQLKELPKKKEELTSDELRKIKGGGMDFIEKKYTPPQN